MSNKVYYLSFSSILLVQMLKVAYSSVKPELKKQYQLQTSFLAFMDVMISFAVASGFFLKYYFLRDKHPISTLRLNGMSMCFFYLILPVVSLIHPSSSPHIQALLIGSFTVFGFLYSFFWPVLRSEFEKYFNRDSDECMYSSWQTARNLGRILAFVFMTMTKRIGWSVSLIFLSVLMIIDINVLHYYMVVNEKETLRQAGIEDLELGIFKPSITMDQFWQFMKKCFWKPQIRYLVLLCSIYKGMYQNFVYWLPTYLFSHNFKELSGQITLAFIIPILAGSFIIGKLYQHSRDTQETYHYSVIFLVTTSLFALGGLALLNIMQMNYMQFVMVIFVEGVSIGGFFNIADEQRRIVVDLNGRQTDMMWTLCRGMNSLMSGVITWTIGIVMGIKEKNKQRNVQDSIFNMLFLVSIVGILFLGLFVFAVYQKHQREEEEDYSSSLSS